METGQGREEAKNPQTPRRPLAPGMSGTKALNTKDWGQRRSRATMGTGEQGRAEEEKKEIGQSRKRLTTLAPMETGLKTARSVNMAYW